MKLLHTGDWHVGRTIRGRARTDEHRAVLDEIVAIAHAEAVDLVLVAGDLFETAAPQPEAEALVYRTLLRLAASGAHVAVVAGNHDNARRLHAVAPVFAAAGRVHVVTEPARPDDGGVLRFVARDGADVVLAMLPFVSQRGIVRARDLMDTAAFEHAQAYADRIRLLLDVLTAGFGSETVNLVMAHAFVVGGELGGGERAAHFIDEYALSAQVFPGAANYVALGHVHRAQRIPGAAPIHYCGSPLQLDFGERSDAKQVNVIEVEPGLPARVEPVTLRAGRPLRTMVGSLDDLDAQLRSDGDVVADCWLRVVVREPARAGLSDDVRALLGEGAIDIRVEDTTRPTPLRRPSRRGRSPLELFAEFLAERGIVDPRIEARFAELVDAQLDSSGGPS